MILSRFILDLRDLYFAETGETEFTSPLVFNSTSSTYLTSSSLLGNLGAPVKGSWDKDDGQYLGWQDDEESEVMLSSDPFKDGLLDTIRPPDPSL